MATIQGFDALERKLKALPVEAKRQMAAALDKDADELVAAQKALAHFRSGKTKESIRKEPGANELQVIVRAGGPLTTKEVRTGSGAPYDYALGEELGTKGHIVGGLYAGAWSPGTKKQDTAFFWPAYRLLKKRMRSRIKRAVNKAAKTVWNGS